MKEKFTITNIDRKRVLICRFGLRRHRQCADENLFKMLCIISLSFLVRVSGNIINKFSSSALKYSFGVSKSISKKPPGDKGVLPLYRAACYAVVCPHFKRAVLVSQS